MNGFVLIGSSIPNVEFLSEPLPDHLVIEVPKPPDVLHLYNAPAHETELTIYLEHVKTFVPKLMTFQFACSSETAQTVDEWIAACANEYGLDGERPFICAAVGALYCNETANFRGDNTLFVHGKELGTIDVSFSCQGVGKPVEIQVSKLAQK